MAIGLFYVLWYQVSLVVQFVEWIGSSFDYTNKRLLFVCGISGDSAFGGHF